MPFKIQVIDDEERIIDLMVRRGVSLGHTMIGVTDSTQALARVEAEMPDAIVLDLMMPRLDGRDLLSRLKANPATRAIPVFIVTARLDEHTRELCLQYGATEFLEKPFNVGDLFASIERILTPRK